MARFVENPVYVDAIQYTRRSGGGAHDILRFVTGFDRFKVLISEHTAFDPSDSTFRYEISVCGTYQSVECPLSSWLVFTGNGFTAVDDRLFRAKYKPASDDTEVP